MLKEPVTPERVLKTVMPSTVMVIVCFRPILGRVGDHCAQFKRGPKIFRKGTKRGPDFEQKGDLKGTKRGPKRGPKTRVVQKIEKR